MKRLAYLALSACSIQPGTSGDDTTMPLECDPATIVAPGADSFVDISAQSGIQANNFTPSPATPIPINDHSRLAFIDLFLPSAIPA